MVTILVFAYTSHKPKSYKIKSIWLSDFAEKWHRDKEHHRTFSKIEPQIVFNFNGRDLYLPQKNKT